MSDLGGIVSKGVAHKLRRTYKNSGWVPGRDWLTFFEDFTKRINS